MFDTQLMLIATSALLIFIKNGLLHRMPGTPWDYEHVFNFYRSCDRFADLINELTLHIDVNHIELHPDINQVVVRFIGDLNDIAEFVRLSSHEPEPNNFRTFIRVFRQTLEGRIRGLYTTLCDKMRCKTCNP